MNKQGAKILIEQFKAEYSISKIDKSNKGMLQRYIEERYGKKMGRPFHISIGVGGGQKYKILWHAQAIEEGAGLPSIFFSEVPSAISYLKGKSHTPLWEWINQLTN